MKRKLCLPASLIFIASISAVNAQDSKNQPLKYKYPSDQKSTSKDSVQVPQLFNEGANVVNHITDLFQAAVHNGLLNSNNGEYQLTFSPYAIDELFRTKKFTDQDYLSKKNARNVNFSFIVGTDKNNHLVSFSPSVKFSIVNNRDVSNFLNAPVVQQNALTNSERNLVIAAGKVGDQLTQLVRNETDPKKKKLIQAAELQLRSLHDSTAAQIQQFFVSHGVKPDSIDLKEYEAVIDTYKSVKQQVGKLIASIQKGKLITLQGGGLVKSNSFYGVSAKLEYLEGTGWKSDKNMPWDVDAYISANIQRDSLLVNNNTWERQVFSCYVGLNKVLLYTAQQPNQTTKTQSLLEIKGSAGVDYIPWVKFQKEKTWNPALDFVLSTRLTGNLYLPLEIKYSPTNSTLFGFLKLQLNLPATSGTK